MSKPITAAAVMILLEEGVIDLYEPVSRYVPSFGRQSVMEGDEIVPVQKQMIIKRSSFYDIRINISGPIKPCRA